MYERIAQIITLSEYGGAQKHVLILSSLLAEKGYSVDIYAGAGDMFQSEIKQDNIKFIRVKNLIRNINIVKDFKAAVELYGYLKKGKYDVAHCHSSKAGLLGRVAAKFAGVRKIVFTAHGFEFNEPMSRYKKLFYIMLERITALFCDKIIVVSQFDYDSAIKYKIAPEKKLVYIPNAIDDIDKAQLKDKSLLRKELNIPEDEFILGTMANFYATKGYKYLAEALKRLYDENYKFTALLVGTGLLYNNIKDMCRDYENIRFLGFRKDNYDLINMYDLFILSSVKEGMPYVILETMKLAKPILCTNVGALNDIIKNGKNGFIVEPESSDAIYDALKNILDNKDILMTVGKNAKNFVDKNFSLSDFSENILNIYNFRVQRCKSEAS